MRKGTVLAAGLAAVVPWALGCGEPEPLTLPDASELEGLYGPAADVRLDGNVVEVMVEQDPDHLARGGALWARAGPYIFLFSPQTREIFQRYDGVAAVRVRTVRGPGGDEVGRATLRRDTLTVVSWQRANQRVARARQEGTERPWYLEQLVRFGEEWAEYEYAEPFHRE